MRNGNMLRIAVVAGLLTAGGAWAATLPVVKPNAKGKVTSRMAAQAANNYSPATREQLYHARIRDPKVSWLEKCQLAMEHNRLQLLSTDVGGPLRGTLESGTSFLTARLYCPNSAVLTADIPTAFTVATAPHSDDPEGQSFDTNMYSISGSATDVPGFSSISLVGGTSNGYDSPGHFALISDGKGGYVIQSTFTIGYRIDYVGAPGGPLDGGSGSIEGSIVMQATN